MSSLSGQEGEVGSANRPRCHRPVWALPYFSPSCQGTTRLLANLDFSIQEQPLSSFPGAATTEGGPCPAVFPGNPCRWRLEGRAVGLGAAGWEAGPAQCPSSSRGGPCSHLWLPWDGPTWQAAHCSIPVPSAAGEQLLSLHLKLAVAEALPHSCGRLGPSVCQALCQWLNRSIKENLTRNAYLPVKYVLLPTPYSLHLGKLRQGRVW